MWTDNPTDQHQQKQEADCDPPRPPGENLPDSGTGVASTMRPDEHGARPRSIRGFAAMDAARQRAIASKGGHSQGKANNPGNFANDRQKAREAGRKGGLA